ncbi:hypothetical protein HNR10_004128 [Nocardiopsis aegyptia]|uniref:Uncharacterized protein n=1 Tax=Nocardiopsis aegyptia TaxID=220378 RepID=A0A7Z0EQ67_9ACTN|nr:hypothetical protein [Nocardiopsis aegyptia]
MRGRLGARAWLVDNAGRDKVGGVPSGTVNRLLSVQGL